MIDFSILNLFNLITKMIDFSILNFYGTFEFSLFCFMSIKWVEKRKDWNLLSYRENNIPNVSSDSWIIYLIKSFYILRISFYNLLWFKSLINQYLFLLHWKLLTNLTNKLSHYLFMFSCLLVITVCNVVIYF